MIADSFCILKRFYSQQKIFRAHNLHLCQRLCKSGLTHGKVSLLYIISSLIIIGYTFGGISYELIICLIILLIGIFLDKNVAVKFNDTENLKKKHKISLIYKKYVLQEN